MPDINPNDASQGIPSSEPSPADLHGLDPGELLARCLETGKPSGGLNAWEPLTAEELTRLLPEYRIERLIGRGGMGAVYQGTQINLDRSVAIKLLPIEIAADEQFVARFQREARTLARLQHSRIITIHDFGETSEGHLYFVMEYIDGTDLRKILRGPGLNPEQALLVVGQICDALHAAHSQGVIHRDIKPENILVTKDGYVKLGDFGLARPLNQREISVLTETDVVMGTEDYMAPEQREGQADARADIFALGVMLYEMLTGRLPRGVFEPASEKVRLDARIDQVVLKALQTEPEHRYQNISEMKTDVDRIRTTPIPRPAVVRAAPAAPQKKEIPVWKRGQLTFSILLALAGCLYWVGKRNLHSAGPRILVREGKPFTPKKKMDGDQGSAGTGPAVAVKANSQAPWPSPANAVPEILTMAYGEERSLFNGKDLTGWEGRSDIWSVESGAITCRAKSGMHDEPRLHLVWQGGIISDFELRYSFYFPAKKNAGRSNPGFMFRGELLNERGFIRSYYNDLRCNHESTGNLWDGIRWSLLASQGQRVEVGDGNPAEKPPIRILETFADPQSLRLVMKNDDWNRVKIVAKGNRVQIFVNERQTVDVTDNGSQAPKSGLLAISLGAFKDPYLIQFKDIALRNLQSNEERDRRKASLRASVTPADQVSSKDSEALMKALTSGKWSLRYDSIAQQPNEQLTFDRDGTMAMQGFKCEWRMIGPRAICIYPLHKAISLKFNNELTHYSAFLAGGDARYSGDRFDQVALPAPVSKPMPAAAGKSSSDGALTKALVSEPWKTATPAPPDSATKLTRLLLEHDWTHGRFRTGILHFNGDHFGTLTNGKDGVRRFSWKELGEFTARIVMIDGGTDAGKVGSEATYTFASDGSGYSGVGFGGSADTGGSRHRSSDHASVSTASPPAANPTTPRTYGSSQEEALFGHNWSWETVANGRTIVVQFLEDGRVSGGWHWQWFPKPGGELLVDCFWGEKEHMYLKFDQRFTGFEGYNPGGGLETRGRRLDAIVPGGR